MGRQIGSMVGFVLLLAALGGCAGQGAQTPAVPVKAYPTSFSVPDPELDAESTAEDLAQPPNVDLAAISAAVGYYGIRARFTYAPGWNPDLPSRWGIRFEIKGSDGSRISGAWTQDPASAGLSRRVDLAPRPAGCTGSVHVSSAARRLALALGPGCLPGASPSEPRRWIRFDTIAAVSSWHSGSQILYAWDQLYSRVIAPEPERLYLPH